MSPMTMEALAASPHVAGTSTDEAIVDLFAGGGGASTAILMATGRHPDVAVNHDPNAVALHAANHPTTRHYCCDVFEVDPKEACRDAHGNLRKVGLLWASPDCTHHSKARGGKPADKKIRALAWVVVKWAAALRPRCIFLENVEEFQDWGPLDVDNRPDKARKGEIFRTWVSQLEALGYAVDWRELVAADYGAPTTRKRLFLVARNDGRPIIWPEPTHAPRHKIAAPDLFSKPLAPWRPAADIIDWSLPCPSIFDRSKPLAPKTQKRIARGIKRFVVEAAEPFIVPVTHSGQRRTPGADEPLATVTSANRGEFALAVPTLTPRYGEREGQEPRTMDIGVPYPTVVPTGNGGDLTSFFLSRSDMHSSADRAGIRDVRDPMATVVAAGGLAGVGVGLGGPFVMSNNTNNAPHAISAPVPTVTTGNRNYLTAAHVTKFRADSAGADAAAPLPTVTANSFVKRPGGAAPIGVVETTLAPMLVGTSYGDGWARAGLRAWSACDPARTITSAGQGGFTLAVAHLTKFSENSIGTNPADPLHTAMAGAPRHGLVIGHLGRQFGTAVGRDLAEPHPTVMTDGAGGKSYLATACLTSYYGTGIGSSADGPLPTVVTKDRHALNAAYIEQANTGMTGRDAREPLSTIVAGGGEESGWSTTQRPITARLEPLEGQPGSKRAKVVAFLREHFGEPTEAEREDPLATASGRLRFGLVMVDGVAWQITDIGMRMLVPKELYGAQGFPADYIIDRTADGRPLTKTAQTRMAGNSVSPPPAAAMIAANDPLLQRQARAA